MILPLRSAILRPSGDPDAARYIAAVEAADGQALEAGVISAYRELIAGLKTDGIWGALKASCILAGARTLSGALVPLAGASPTNFNFVSDNYNRKTGLLGDGSTKYLDTNRTGNADPQNNFHAAVYLAVLGNQTRVLFGVGVTGAGTTGMAQVNTARCRSAVVSGNYTATVGLVGLARSSSSEFLLRTGGVTSTQSVASDGNISDSINIYRRGNASPAASDARLSFYSIGESIDLAALDARVTTLMNAFSAAIP